MEIRLAWVSFLLVAVFAVSGCSTQYKINKENANRQCFYRPKFTAEERLKNYPFHAAAQVVLTSYEGGFEGKAPGSPDLERIVLHKSRIDSLPAIK